MLYLLVFLSYHWWLGDEQLLIQEVLQAFGSPTAVNKPPIDDYFSRTHIRTNVPMVVGGSDGSGTRAFVDILDKLGVPMMFEDKTTLDMHGLAMYKGEGWPPLAKAVLKEQPVPNYDFEDLSETLQKDSLEQLTRLKLEVYGRYSLYLNQTARQKLARRSNVAYGFKAPVTMLLVPILVKVFGRIKYLHVVRDGRDVALSANQSPVKKFYNNVYRDYKERDASLAGRNNATSIKAMQLWNDWNNALYNWGKTHRNRTDVELVTMRIEDLMNPNTRFDALVQLADFVGASMSLHNLCCLSQRPLVDMGKSVDIKRRVSTPIRPLIQQMWSKGLPQDDKMRLLAPPNPLPTNHSWHHGIPGRKHTAPPNKIAAIIRDLRRVAERAKKDKDVAKQIKVEHAIRYYQEMFPTAKSANITTTTTTTTTTIFDFPRIPPTFKREEAAVVAKRYGKWVEKLSDNKQLSADLHEAGAQGLATFGYEPAAEFLDKRLTTTDSFQCNAEVICASPS